MAAGARRNGAKGRSGAIAASVCAHVVVVGLVVWRLGSAPQIADAPAMNVELAILSHRPAPAKIHEPSRDRRGSRLAAPPIPRVPLTVAPSDAREANPIPEPAPQLGPGVVQALRGLLGCEHARLLGLSAEERERCRERQSAEAASKRGQPPAKLNLDQRGDYAVNPELYINRLPTKGCKPRASRDVGPFGQEGAKATVNCAVPF